MSIVCGSVVAGIIRLSGIISGARKDAVCISIRALRVYGELLPAPI